MTEQEARMQMRLEMLNDARRRLEAHKGLYRHSLSRVRADKDTMSKNCVLNDMLDVSKHRQMCLYWLKQVRRAQRHFMKYAH